MTHKHARMAYLALAGAGALWGLGFAFGKAALATMPVGAMLSFRFAIATLVLLPALFFRNGFRIRKGDTRWFVVTALLFVPVQFLVQFEGLARTSVSHASLMIATVPAMLAIASCLLGRHWPTRTTATAVIASVAGAILVTATPSRNAHLAGDILVLVSLFASLAWVLITQHRLPNYEPVAATAALVAMGTAGLLAFEIVTNPHDLVRQYPLQAWLATAAAGILSTSAATMLWNIGLQRIRTAEAGVFVNLEPVVGTVCGVLFFGDALSWQVFAGGALVVAAAVIIALRGPRDERAPVETRPVEPLKLATEPLLRERP